jgi:hypothetical protein
VGSRRKRADVDSDDEDYGDFAPDEELQLFAITENSINSLGSKNRESFVTPAVDRMTTVIDGMPTPSLTSNLTSKPVRRVLFADELEPSNMGQSTTKRHHADELGANTNLGAAGSTASTSLSFEDEANLRTPGSSSITKVTQDVMRLLQGQNIDVSILHDVKSALEEHAATAKGFERGREASRLAVKKAEAKIALLRQQIIDLENARRLDFEARKKM